MSNFENLPERIKIHLEDLIRSSNLSNSEETKDLMASIWIEKKKLFEEQAKALDMIEVEFFRKDDERGVLLLTYSGSLISLSPIKDMGRNIEYYSIKLRHDVPEVVIMSDSNVSGDIMVDNSVHFTRGPIQKTSSIFKIVSFKEDVGKEEQDKRIRQATIFLTNAFVKVNRTVFIKDKNIPDQFNIKSIAKFIASKNGITQKLAKQIIEDYQYIVECGILLGDRVRIGGIGSIVLRKRSARKARVGINPRTGEKITIDAKPEMMKPRMSFGKSFKEKAATVAIKG